MFTILPDFEEFYPEEYAPFYGITTVTFEEYDDDEGDDKVCH